MSRRSFLTSSLASLMLLQTDGPDLDHRLVHLGLHPLLQEQLALFDDLRVDVRAQIARDRIDGLIFLFDPDGESRQHKKV